MEKLRGGVGGRVGGGGGFCLHGTLNRQASCDWMITSSKYMIKYKLW